MNLLERYCISLRHYPALENTPLWGIVRPIYNTFLEAIASKKGLERTINGTDSIRLHPRWRGVQESYEPPVWKHLMDNVRQGDTVVDVGAFIGLYTIALAKRVGPQGFVFAFEPDPANFSWLQRHISLNHVSNNVTPPKSALAQTAGERSFIARRDSQSHVGKGSPSEKVIRVPCLALDVEFQNQRIDLLKIDVEGFEEKVLRGGVRLLKDALRCPRFIYIEVHPYAWKKVGTSSGSLLRLLTECGYSVAKLDGQSVVNINVYGEIIAHKNVTHR